ncbi:MAG: transcriptional regulator, XRE family [Leptospirillum sp. Group II 'C75']|nr:MAG: transcriptional regulator, XRE family [Leptospirillum sp. Group II 'C75']
MAKKRIELEEVRYDPVAFDVEQTKKEWMDDPVFKVAYDLLEDEFSALDVLLKARKEARLTQAEVANRMGVHPSALARIESSLGSRRHSPSLETLRKYARACGKRLEIRIV